MKVLEGITHLNYKRREYSTPHQTRGVAILEGFERVSLGWGQEPSGRWFENFGMKEKWYFHPYCGSRPVRCSKPSADGFVS